MSTCQHCAFGYHEVPLSLAEACACPCHGNPVPRFPWMSDSDYALYCKVSVASREVEAALLAGDRPRWLAAVRRFGEALGGAK